MYWKLHLLPIYLFWASQTFAQSPSLPNPICSLQSTRECSFAAESLQKFNGYEPSDAPTRRVFDKLIKEFCGTIKDCSDEQLECKTQKANKIRQICLVPPPPISVISEPISEKCKEYLKHLKKGNFVQSLVDLTTSDKIDKRFICSLIKTDKFLVKNAHRDVLNSCGIPEDEALKEYIEAKRKRFGCDKKLSVIN